MDPSTIKEETMRAPVFGFIECPHESPLFVLLIIQHFFLLLLNSHLFLFHRLIVLIPGGNQENNRIPCLLLVSSIFTSSYHCWIVIIPRGNEESICLSTVTNALLKPPGRFKPT